MPYINKLDRAKFDEHLNKIEKISVKGELEYCIFKLMKIYMKDKEANYTELHSAVYACIHSGEEFKRRNLDKREDFAIEKNGDI